MGKSAPGPRASLLRSPGHLPLSPEGRRAPQNSTNTPKHLSHRQILPHPNPNKLPGGRAAQGSRWVAEMRFPPPERVSKVQRSSGPSAPVSDWCPVRVKNCRKPTESSKEPSGSNLLKVRGYPLHRLGLRKRSRLPCQGSSLTALSYGPACALLEANVIPGGLSIRQRAIHSSIRPCDFQPLISRSRFRAAC